MSKPIAFVTLHVRPCAQAVPLGTASVAASLPDSVKSRVVQVELYLHQDLEQMIGAIVRTGASLVALSIYVWNHQAMVALAVELRKRCPKLVLVAGGPEVTAAPQAFSAANLFDTVVCGEGEGIISDIVEGADRHYALKSLYRNQKPVDLTRQVSPWLDGELVPGEGVLWEVSRGCPFRCSFCFDARGDEGVRTVPFSRLERELALFVEHRVSQVWVLDSTFNYPPERGKQLLRLIKRIAPHIHFHLEAKIEFIDDELAQLLSEIHCSVQIGLQSANPDVVRHVHRHFDAELFQEKIALLHFAEVTYGIDLMYGLPGDNEVGLKHSLEFVLQLQPNHIDLFPLAVLPGTELYHKHNDYGLHAEAAPPYRLLSSDSMSEDAMLQCRYVAVWTDVFYNTGRAMGYFLEVCQAVNQSGVAMIEAFGRWLSTSRGMTADALMDDALTSERVVEWQKDFFHAWLADNGHENLCGAIDDLICFHACWAQAQLDEDLPQPDRTDFGEDCLLEQQNWRWPDQVTIQRFHYNINEWLLVDGDLVEQSEYGEQNGSVALFFRSDNQAQCVTIDGIDANRFPCGAALPSCDALMQLGAIVDEDDYRDWLKQAVDYGLVSAVVSEER
nr:B12-binding domain-containing radical SAM protein [uncultured Desulfuromonas sp.]